MPLAVEKNKSSSYIHERKILWNTQVINRELYNKSPPPEYDPPYFLTRKDISITIYVYVGILSTYILAVHSSIATSVMFFIW